MVRSDPLRNFRYRIEIDKLAVAGFSEVSLPKAGNVTLRHGITVGNGSLYLFDWFKAASGGDRTKSRKRITIVVKDETGRDKARFLVGAAWPVKYEASDLDAKGNEVMIEMLELANEGIETQD